MNSLYGHGMSGYGYGSPYGMSGMGGVNGMSGLSGMSGYGYPLSRSVFGQNYLARTPFLYSIDALKKKH